VPAGHRRAQLSGDSTTALARLFTSHRAQVVRIAFGFTHDRDEAEDIAQDTFLRAFRFRSRMDPDRDQKSWLFVIARRCSVDSLRRSRRASALAQRGHDLPGIAASPEQLVLEQEDRLAVRGSIAGLSPRYRSAIRLYYLQGLCYREIAAELQIPLGTVKTLIYRAKAQLKTELECVSNALELR
jgi:RNA polymerase sigma-70 factor (ECF subfamily)